MKKLIIISLFGLFSLSACNDLDIPPKNLITDEGLMTSESGLAIYMARMYSYMPFEDFKYRADIGFEYQGWLNAMGYEGTGEAMNRDGICRSFTSEGKTYWNDTYAAPFKLLHDANYLLETLPKYKSSYPEITYNAFMGEAYYVRATVFTAMAKRFGGVPLVTRVIKYPGESDVLEVPRSTEEQTWDQVLADYDKAIELLPVTTATRGYNTKDIARAFKSEAMLYAGSVAKYNETVTGRLTGLGSKTGVRVIGFSEATWKSASIRYFKEAYSAARTVIENGTYSLYKKKWVANDPTAQYQNMVDMFSDMTSPENIYVKEYVYPTFTHAYDSYNQPAQFESLPLSSGTCPTLDFLELFEGFPRYGDGTVKVTTGTNNVSGNYVMYDNPMKFFENAEPRLRAYVIFPGDVFKGQVIDIKAGTYTGTEPISPLFSNYSYANSTVFYQNLAAYTGTPKKLYLSPRAKGDQETLTYNGTTINAAGLSGPFYNDGGSAMTGLYGRKWLNPSSSFIALEGNSAQPFILMRYAEVLLNVAEAAVELSLLEQTAPDGGDLMQIATDAVNQIRERAGATLYSGVIPATNAGRNEIRKERRKELAMENKTKWDIRRWRVIHYEGRNGFWGEEKDKDKFSNNDQFRFRGLYPFFSTASGKYFFDARYQWVSQKTFSYSPVDYYFAIPGGEVSKSLVIDQQPNR